MTTVDMQPNEFRAMVALYSIIHIPLSKQKMLFHRVHDWLEPRGLFLAIVGADSWTGTEVNWLESGAEMYWSHSDRATYLQWLTTEGFEVLWDRNVPEGDGGHTIVLSRATISE